MKGWTKRRVALILALALIASQMSACTENGNATQNAASVSNNNAVVTEATESTAEEETEPVDADGWLEENLDNIRQSLLDGDYAEVVDILLGMQDQLANDPDFNALLYIAYMGNGNENEAAALLNNPNLDTDAFTDAFLENTEALKGNEDMADIERKLMEHMLALGESDPDAYAAVARIGADICNDDPTDPTAYVARYIAALAAGDEAAAKAILAEAKANGITKEAFESAAIELKQEVELATITATNAGTTTSTTYTEGGAVVGTEVVKPDGSGYHYSKLDNVITAELQKDPVTGKLISKTQYIFTFTTDKNTGEIIATPTGEKEVYLYTDGKLTSMTSYDADGNKGYEIALNNKGEILSAKDYSSGTEKGVPQDQIDVLNFDTDANGNIISRTIPVVDASGNVVGKIENRYTYDNPAGAVAGQTIYEGSAKTEDLNITYSYETLTNAEGDKYAEAYYNTHEVKDYKEYATFSYQHKDGDVISSTTVAYEKDWTTVKLKMEVDNVNHTSVVTENGNVFNWVLDSSNTYQLYADVELGDKSSGAEYVKIYKTYKGTEHVANLDVYYDADGRILMEDYYTIDGVTPDGSDNPVANTLVEYTYDASGKVATKTTTSIDYITYDYSSETIEYEYDGNKVVKETYGDGFFTTAVVKHTYDENGRKVKTEKYDVDWLYEDETLSQTTDYTYIQNDDGSETVTSEQKDAYGSVTGTQKVDVTYNDSGKKELESSYTIDSEGNKIPESVIQYSYNEKGEVSGYSVTAVNADGTPGKTITYTPDGHAYQTEVTPEVAMMIMRMTRGENASVGEETTGTGSTESGSTEGGNTEGGNTEGGNTEGGNTEGGNTEGGNTEDGNTEGGNTEGGNTEGGNTEGGNTEGGNTEGGNTEGGNTEGDNTEGGNTEGDNTEGGNTEGGNTEGGNIEGGNTEGGNTEGGNTEGGNTEGDNTEGGNTEGGNTEGGNTEGGNIEGGNTEGGSTEDDTTEGGTTEDGNTEGGTTEGGNTEDDTTEGGNTEGGTTEGGTTEGGNTAGGNGNGGDSSAQASAVTETPAAPKEPESPAEPENNEPAGE